MTHPVLGIVVTIGVIIGSALFYYLNSESRQSYTTGYGSTPNHSYSAPPRTSPRARRRRYGRDCIICLESLTNGKTVESLQCQHEFHKSCIATWFQTSHTRACPICRFDRC